MSQSSSSSTAAASSTFGGDTYGPGPTYNVGPGAGNAWLMPVLLIAGAALAFFFILKRRKP